MYASAHYDVVAVEDPIFHEEAYLLRDNAVGSSALVIPALGNNLMSFVASLPEARQIEVILGAPAGTTNENAWRWGNPILFPFPNRVQNGRYAFEGRRYQLDVNMTEGHHLHGLVCDRPWQVDEAAPGPQGATLRCSLNASDHPEVLRQYPFPFLLTVAYVLSGNVLRCEAEVRNVGRGPLPMGFGLHPYFRAPLGAAGSREKCLISVPAKRMWQLHHDKIPTGHQGPVPPGLDFRKLRPLDRIYLDDSYTDLLREDGAAICRLIDPAALVEVVERFGPEFPELVALAPADRATVSFEPYSCVTNAINLATQRPDTGLVVLKPGDSWQGRVEFSVGSVAR